MTSPAYVDQALEGERAALRSAYTAAVEDLVKCQKERDALIMKQPPPSHESAALFGGIVIGVAATSLAVFLVNLAKRSGNG